MPTQRARATLRLALTLLVAAFAGSLAAAQSVSVAGDWSASFGSSQLAAGAGSAYDGPRSSPADVVTVDVTSLLGYRVDVRRSDAGWHPGLHLQVRRSGAGSGLGSVAGGDTYRTVDALDTLLFGGLGSRSGIGLQYRVEADLTVPPGTYSTTVTFTVTAQ